MGDHETYMGSDLFTRDPKTQIMKDCTDDSTGTFSQRTLRSSELRKTSTPQTCGRLLRVSGMEMNFYDNWKVWTVGQWIGPLRPMLYPGRRATPIISPRLGLEGSVQSPESGWFGHILSFSEPARGTETSTLLQSYDRVESKDLFFDRLLPSGCWVPRTHESSGRTSTQPDGLWQVAHIIPFLLETLKKHDELRPFVGTQSSLLFRCFPGLHLHINFQQGEQHEDVENAGCITWGKWPLSLCIWSKHESKSIMSDQDLESFSRFLTSCVQQRPVIRKPQSFSSYIQRPTICDKVCKFNWKSHTSASFAFNWWLTSNKFQNEYRRSTVSKRAINSYR